MAAPVSDQATQNNQRLFKRYAKIFSTPNPVAFAQHAEKLSVWLGDHKAYYPAARPEIIKLLLIAQTTIRRDVGITENFEVSFSIYDYPDNLYAPYYKLLVEAVLPFEGQFSEPGLIAHIQSLKYTVAERNINLIQGSCPDSLPPSSNMENRSSGSLVINDIPSATSLEPAISLTESSTLSTSVHNATPIQPQPNTTIKPQNATNTVKRVKKRKTLDLDALAQTDIEGLLLKKEQTKPSDEEVIGGGHSTPQPTSHDPLTSQPVSTDQNASGTNDMAGENASTSDKAPAIEEISVTNAPQETQLDTPAQPVAEPSDIPMEVDNAVETPTPKDSDKMDVEIRGQTQEVELKDQEQNLQVLGELQSNLLNVQETFHPSPSEVVVSTVAPETLPSLPVQLPRPDELPQIIDVDAHESVQPSTLLDEQTQIRAEELGVPEVVIIEPTIDVMDTSLPEASAMLKNHVDVPSVESMNKLPTPSPSPSESMGQSSVFTSDMRVVASQRGTKDRSRIIIQFDIPEAQFQQVSIWMKRSKFQPMEKIKSSICVSLGCYLTQDLEKASHENDDCTTAEKQVLANRATWPPHGQLSVNIELAGSRQNLPLAPPLKVTPDNLVDISDFLKKDQNFIELNQYRDLSQFTYVLHAHFPTRAQLKEVEKQWQKNKEWDKWVQNVSRPLKNPLRPIA